MCIAHIYQSILASVNYLSQYPSKQKVTFSYLAVSFNKNSQSWLFMLMAANEKNYQVFHFANIN